MEDVHFGQMEDFNVFQGKKAALVALQESIAKDYDADLWSVETNDNLPISHPFERSEDGIPLITKLPDTAVATKAEKVTRDRAEPTAYSAAI